MGEGNGVARNVGRNSESRKNVAGQFSVESRGC